MRHTTETSFTQPKQDLKRRLIWFAVIYVVSVVTFAVVSFLLQLLLLH
jgi:Protein of unknown function (DUF2474)